MTKYPIDGPWSGELFVIARPRGADWLEDELGELRREGFDVIVSLLTGEEKSEMGLLRFAEMSKSHGIDFYEFPIPDLGTPPLLDAEQFLDHIKSDLDAGRQVGIHCRQSIGRSGLMAIGLLIMAGVEPESAIRRVSSARGLSVPETTEQRDWLYTLAQDLIEPAAKR
jgi:protein-tyrosine phosphatase